MAIDAFDYGYRYELARSRWRLAAALAGAGDQVGAQSAATAALAAATEMRARPLAGAVADLGRRARLDLPGARSSVGLLPTAKRRCSGWWRRD